MSKGVAVVEYRVSTDPKYCEYNAPDDDFCERSVCRYKVRREKTGKIEVRIKRYPRCDLFKEWLESDGFGTVRCLACRVACGEVKADER